MRQRELRDAIEESPLSTFIEMIIQQLAGFPAYLILNTAGQRHYPAGTSRKPILCGLSMVDVRLMSRFQHRIYPFQAAAPLSDRRFEHRYRAKLRHFGGMGIQAVLCRGAAHVYHPLPLGESLAGVHNVFAAYRSSSP